MSLSLQDAYAQLKKLENNGTIKLPTPQQIVEVGTIDAATGVFTFSVPTQDQAFFDPTTISPAPGHARTHTAGGTGATGIGTGIGNPVNNPGPGGGPFPPTHLTLGIVQTSAVDLILKFNIVGVSQKPASKPSSKELSAHFGKGFQPPFFPPQSGVTLTYPGWKVLSSPSNEILLDAGFAASSALNSHYIQPPIENFPIQVNTAAGEQFIHIAILRPPVLGFGAFTIPTLPLAIIYAPPQGKLNSNTTVWIDMVANTHTLTTSVTTASNTKSVPAYSTADLIGKVTGAITTVAGLVAAAGAGGAAGAGASAGASADAGLTLGQSLTLIQSEFAAVSTIVGAFDNTNMSNTSPSSTIESDQTITVNLTTTLSFTTKAGKGPGVGDTFVCLQNLRVVWVAVNGEVGISILGYDALAAPTAETLIADQIALAGGHPAASGFDAATIHMLLGLDPFCASHSSIAIRQGPPLVSGPRFVAAVPAAYNGSDQTFNFTASLDTTTDDKSIRTSITTSVEDIKPGWGSVLFGTPNVETTTTMTFTNSQTTEDTTEEKITNSATFISDSSDDGYHIVAFYDRAFGTVLFADRNSFVLQGSGGTVAHGEASN